MHTEINMAWHDGALIWTVWKDGRFIGSALTYQEGEKMLQTKDDIILHI